MRSFNRLDLLSSDLPKLGVNSRWGQAAILVAFVASCGRSTSGTLTFDGAQGGIASVGAGGGGGANDSGDEVLGGSAGAVTGGETGGGATEADVVTPDASPNRPPGLRVLVGGFGAQGASDGIGTAARFTNPQGIASDGAGNVFVADPDTNTIRRLVLATGVVSTFAGAGMCGRLNGVGKAATFCKPQSIASDGAGNLFVADFGNNQIRKIVIATAEVTTLYGWDSGVDGGTESYHLFDGPRCVTYDGSGTLFVADANRIRKVVLATGEVRTLAGAEYTNWSPGMFRYNMEPYRDGTGPAARFFDPMGLATDGAGNLFVAEATNTTIRKIVIATGVVTTLAGNPNIHRISDGTGTEALFLAPQGMAYDGNGNLLVADGNTLRKVAISSGVVTTVAGSISEQGCQDGIGLAARFYKPRGIVGDGSGNLFIADSSNYTVRKMVLATSTVTTLAGSPQTFPGQEDGVGPAARFRSPAGLATDRDGNLFVADTDNKVVRKIVLATGAVTSLGRGIFSAPTAVTSDGAGNVFVSDSSDDAIRKVDVFTGMVTEFAGSPGARATEDGVGLAAMFSNPHGIVYDGAGNLFVADTSADTLRRIVIATRTVTTIAGDADDSSGSVDGIGTAARFRSPTGLAYDGAGNLFVSDTANHTIRKMVLGTSAVTTLAGSAGVAGSSDGIGAAARFHSPKGLALDGEGTLYVADSANHTVRKIVLATGAVTTVVGVAGLAGVVLGPLPGGLKLPVDVAFASTGELYITTDFAVLAAKF
jgi:sugar lactone lactonase YvrE